MTKEQWEGISQRLENKDMGPRECAVSILKILIPTGPTACRLPSHGIARYQREFETTKSSGWVQGGSGHNYYDDQVNELKAQNPGADVALVHKQEHSKDGCPPFRCILYQYTGAIHVKADPLYISRVDPACPTGE